MSSFIHDIIHMTQGELFLKYWWLIILLSVVSTTTAHLLAKKGIGK